MNEENFRIMKCFILTTFSLLATFFVQAQKEHTYTKEEFVKYARLSVWAENRHSQITKQYNNSIEKNEVLSVPRYKQIKDAKADSAALIQLKVTTEEFLAFTKISNIYDSLSTLYATSFKERVRNGVGVKLYNDLKESLLSDVKLRTQYEQVESEIREERKN